MFHLILAVWANIKIYKPTMRTMLNLVLRCTEMSWYFDGSVSAIAIRWPRRSSTLTDVTEIWDRVHMSEVCQSVSCQFEAQSVMQVYPNIPQYISKYICNTRMLLISLASRIIQPHAGWCCWTRSFPLNFGPRANTEAATRSRSYQKTPLIIFNVFWVELQLPWLCTKHAWPASGNKTYVALLHYFPSAQFGFVASCGVRPQDFKQRESLRVFSQRTRPAYSILTRTSSSKSQEFTFHCPGSFCLERCWKRRIQGPKWLLVGTRPHHGSEKHNSSSMLLCISNVVPESLVLLQISATWQVHPQEIISWKTHLSSAPCGKAPKKNTSRQWSCNTWTLRC